MHTTVSKSESVSSGLGELMTSESADKKVRSFDDMREFHALLLNIQGLTKEKTPVLAKLISPFDIVGLTETHVPHATFGFPGGWTVYAAPRTVHDAALSAAAAISALCDSPHGAQRTAPTRS